MKRSTKRKMYQKRRKQEKAKQRNKIQSMAPGTTKNTNKYNYSTKQFKRDPINTNSNEQTPINSYSQGLLLWWQTYCSAIEFHTKQQNYDCFVECQDQSKLLEKYANEYETSSEEDEENAYQEADINDNDVNKNNAILEEYIDEDFIKFLEVTHKHREELRIKKAEDH